MLSWAISAWGTELEPGQGPPNFSLQDPLAGQIVRDGLDVRKAWD